MLKEYKVKPNGRDKDDKTQALCSLHNVVEILKNLKKSQLRAVGAGHNNILSEQRNWKYYFFSYEVAESLKEYVHFVLCFEGAEFVIEKGAAIRVNRLERENHKFL